MFGSDKQREAGRSIFMDSTKGLANTAAAVVAFFATGPLYAKSVNWVTAYTASQYGTGLESLVAFFWFIAVACMAFFVARASVATLIVMGGLALATRLF